MEFTTRFAPEVGTQATGIYVDGKMVGYITENYTFSGVSIMAWVGSGRGNAEPVGGYSHTFASRTAAFDAVKKIVEKRAAK